MVTTVWNYIVSTFTSALNMVNALFTAMGDAWDFIFAGFFVFLVVKYLLTPLFGGSVGSDSVKKSKKRKEDE